MQEITKTIESLSSGWLIKSMASFLITAFSFLVGEIHAGFIALFVLVGIDTLTRWAAIWHGNECISSEPMRKKFLPKVLAYFALIVAGNLITKIIPEMIIFGNDWSKFPGGFIYSFLAITELMSIIENLIECGVEGLKPLAAFICKKRTDMTGSDGK